MSAIEVLERYAVKQLARLPECKSPLEARESLEAALRATQELARRADRRRARQLMLRVVSATNAARIECCKRGWSM